MYDYIDGVADLCDPADWVVRLTLEEELSSMAEDEAYQERWGDWTDYEQD